ncbi:LysR substrate-binding domain-containing protein [Massilia sp. IC2-476]|uniref:LysR substrate-binding domain-containing protein n=1 Tax=Massilia sp. IC2-476 TaxID=2887199 RepID=UPI001D124841|nr:LysR substrate-binding domain-containing protein [Massilia sp. IC2-476]MCC2971017.1 LysR family transcriptional regulator [Massilia sp. IC2-476]
MRRVNFDLDALRTFVAGADLGSFARAADQVGRSASAVSAQLRKLEEQAGMPLLQKSGRGLVLTAAGETMLGYARRMLRMNDEALLALAGSALEGKVRLGLQEDFSDHLLPDVLGKFSRGHRGVQIEVTVGRNADLHDAMRDGRLDLALAWHTRGPTPHMDILGSYPLHWMGPADASLLAAGRPAPQDGPLSLVSIEAPCRLRSAATDALDTAAIPWRIVYASPSLSGVWAAVAAGLGIGVRTGFGLPRSLVLLAPEEHGLPALPRVELALHRSHEQLAPAAARLRELIVEHIVQDARELQAA